MSSPDPNPALVVLADPAATLSRILGALEELERPGHGLPELAFGVSANVVLEVLGPFLRREARLRGVVLRVVPGNFDDPVGDVDRFLAGGVAQMVLLPFFDNLLPAFEAQAPLLPPEILDGKEAEFRGRYRLALQRAAGMNAVYLVAPHRYLPPVTPGGDAADGLLQRFHQALREEAAAFPNVRWIEARELVSRLGRARAFDDRFYFSAKAPYTAAFMAELARAVACASRGFGTAFHKVLVLDCDNTLWGGVIGEDLLEGIRLGPFEHPGNIFWRVQQEFADLEQNGVLLCLCTKNNPADVDEVLTRHPHAALRESRFALRKVNWQDKVANLRALATELNLGLDSFVFLDDSPFECEAVRNQLPMVKVFQVPARLSEYPALVQEIKALFLGGGITAESRSKTEQYRIRAQAEELKAGFGSQEEYLASLGLRVTLARDPRPQIPRLSELTLKSNQFNLTTRRYSEADITRMMESPGFTIYALTVGDRFGDSGLTGILIARWEGDAAQVDSFLMSCRVIGRGIEQAVWAPLLADARARGCRTLQAEFRPTAKNAQVADFFDGLGLPRIAEDPAGVRTYRIDLDSFNPPPTPWIEVVDAG
ncbi:MAG TPA: HAD-IIIC family phosphatase [Holophagaceae bacterium]|nr:HAD-IIIC family phosphatase [Holophagaceae bacterium]